ncbi:MAG: methyltransferase [Parvibaculaceae bacterium]
MTTGSDLPPAQAILRMISGAWIAQAIFVAAKLGIADLLRDRPRSPEALAEAVQMHPRALYRILRALASVGVFSVDEAGRFHNTPLSEALRSDRPDSIRPYAIMAGSEWVWRSWGEIMHSVRTETSAFEKVYGASLFEHHAKDPESARIFSEGLTSRSRPEDAAVVSAYDFSAAGAIVDVAGGQGTLLAAILAANPAARGILFEMPHVVAMSQATLEQAGVAERCTLVDGDIFVSIPKGGDIYLLKKIIHDFYDPEAHKILRTVREAIPPHGRLLLIELVIPAGNEASFSKLLDLLMLVYPGGRERTEVEYGSLLASAGFKMTRVLPTTSTVSLVEAVPV